MDKVNRILQKYFWEKSFEDGGRRMAAANIKLLLSAIDFESEVIPENNEDMLTRLLTTLKGEELSPDELAIIKEITEKVKE
jgi:hypothetical protein